ncbi:MAG: prepilin-type N-terminal cleavage/methylation domain-containing protein [Burkholderiales bacterium]|jgi:type IV fimbrial biogenesis protein FimT|nr:prepilin-type N-terminal cleavage/methylation domain-containing protein [Burkholderiales bacterium]
MKAKRYPKGLTLIELMVALAVLATLLFLAAPSISQYLEDRKVRNVAESFFYGMQKARLHAVRTNIQTQFAWSGTGWMVSRCDNGTTLETFDWARWSTISAVAVPSANTEVTFDGAGRVVFPEPPAIQPPDRFDVVSNRKSSRWTSSRSDSTPLRVVVDGGSGVRVCDPQLPSSDPKGCKVFP